jgi:anti-sigma B factor antagonist
MALEIEKTEKDGVTLIAVKGEIDLYTSPKLRTAIVETVPASVSKVAVNLTEVRYMDSSGVATLVEGLRNARDNNRTFMLVSPSEAVMKVLRLAKLDSVFEVSSTP